MANASTVGALRVVLGLDAATFEGGLNKAQAHLVKVGRQMQKAGQQMRTVGLALTAAMVGATTAAGVAVLKLSEQITDLAAEAKTAGVAFKEFQALKYAADRNQVSLAALTDGLKELQLRADEFIKTGKGSGAEAFQRLGFTATDLSKRLKDPAALFEEIIARLQQVDKAAQIRISDEIFGGTGGEQFVRFLDQGIDGIRRLKAEFANSGNLITPEQVKRAEDMRAAVQRLREAVSNVARAFLDTGITQWLTEVATQIANFVSSVTKAVPGLVKWSAVIGGATLALGGLLAVVGTVVSSVGTLLPVFAAVAAAVTKAGGAMVVLKASMAFLVGNVWVLAIMAVVGAIGYLIVKSQQASGATLALKNSTTSLVQAIDAYEAAALAAATASGEGKKAALEEARALRAVAVEARQAAVDKLKSAQASLALARAQLAANEAARRDPTNADARTASGLNQVGYSLAARERRIGAIIEEADKAMKEADARVARIDQSLSATISLPDIRDLSGGDEKNKSGGRTAAELAFARETMKLQAELEAAKLRADAAEVRRLEDIIDRRSRIEAYEGQELSNAAAQIAADRDRALIARAREEAQKKALSDREDELALQIAQMDGDQKIIDLMERKRDLAELVKFYQEQNLDSTEAERRARADLLRIEEARARTRAKVLRDAAQEHQIRLAELAGNERLLKQLRDAKEISDRTLRYRTEGGMDPAAARSRAQQEVGRERQAANYGEARDLFSSAFSDGVRAAMANDLKGFLSNQFGEFMSQAFKRAGEKLFDNIFGGFNAVSEGAAQGSALGAAATPAIVTAGRSAALAMGAAIEKAGLGVAKAMGAAGAAAGGGKKGGFLSGLSSIGGVLSMLPKFSTGAIIPPSGASGIDSQLVSFWKSPREQVSVLNPGQAAGGGGGAMEVFVSPSPYFDVQVRRVAGPLADQAYVRAMNDAPKLTMSQTARQQRQAVGRQRRGS
nr:hypothetical protein [Brevundimonas diminuta]